VVHSRDDKDLGVNTKLLLMYTYHIVSTNVSDIVNVSSELQISILGPQILLIVVLHCSYSNLTLV